jgi:bacillithiol system protein YtxJ
MGLFSSSKKAFPWTELTTESQLDSALQHSAEKPVLFFKHSTRCSISAMALSRFESRWSSGNDRCTIYFLDLLANKPISALIAEKCKVIHQSPQVIVVRNNEVIHTASHGEIDADAIERLL